MKNILALLVVAVAHTCNCQAQQLLNLTKPNTVTSISYFTNKVSKKYHMVTTDQHFKNAETKANRETTIECDITLTVTDSTATGYNMEMRYSNYTFSSNISDEDKELAKVSEITPIKYTINELGVFQSITNTKDLIQSTQKSMDLIIKKLTAKISDEKKKKEIDERLSALKKVLLDENNINALYARDIYNMQRIYGLELILNKPQVMDIDYNTLNEVSLKGTSTITLTEINKPKKECKLTSIEQPNKDELEKYMETIFKVITGGEEEFKTSNFKYTSVSKEVYIMQLDSGWMNKINITHTVTVTHKKESLKKITKTEYKLM